MLQERQQKGKQFCKHSYSTVLVSYCDRGFPVIDVVIIENMQFLLVIPSTKLLLKTMIEYYPSTLYWDDPNASLIIPLIDQVNKNYDFSVFLVIYIRGEIVMSEQ